MQNDQMQAFEAGLLRFLTDRLNMMGIEDSGLLPYYAQRVEKQRPLTRYECELLEYLEGEPVIVHAGIGIGTLSAGLALQGSRVIGFELDQRRFAAALALRQHLAADADYEIRGEPYPSGLRDDDPMATATLLFTNVAGGWPEDLYDAAIRSIQRFRRTILDLRLFGRTRNEVEERETLAARLTDSRMAMEQLPFRAANSFYVELRPVAGE